MENVSIIVAFERLLAMTGFQALTISQASMIAISLLLLYLAIAKEFEPLLLVPIGFGAILANLPMSHMAVTDDGGLLYYFYLGVKSEIWPPLIFLGVGALTDFGPLLSNPSTLFLGAAAQIGVYITLIVAVLIGFNLQEAAAIGIIGGADGPTSIFLANKLAPHLLGPIAVAAYTYMSLVPIIQPPIMRLLTTEKERKIKMEQLKPVSQRAKILFPICTTIVTILLLPAAAPLIGMLMLGNLFRESGVTKRLLETAETDLINTVTIFLALSVGASMTADTFLKLETIKIIMLGLFAFMSATAGGLLLGKLLMVVTGGKVNPLIGSAGVSAVPMAARVSQKVGQEADPHNFLIMHAMGPNVAGVIGTAVAAGVFLALFGGDQVDIMSPGHTELIIEKGSTFITSIFNFLF
ncbi:MAG: sodium ion-translocating decarboxylase subunit beta [Nitrospinota bacterium]